MNGDDQALREILRAVGSMESTLRAQAETNDELKAEVRDLGEKLDGVGITCKTFEMFEDEYQKHKESRRDLPERIRRVEDRVDAIEPTVNYAKSKIPLLIALITVLNFVIVAVWWLIKNDYVRLEI